MAELPITVMERCDPWNWSEAQFRATCQERKYFFIKETKAVSETDLKKVLKKEYTPFLWEESRNSVFVVATDDTTGDIVRIVNEKESKRFRISVGSINKKLMDSQVQKLIERLPPITQSDDTRPVYFLGYSEGDATTTMRHLMVPSWGSISENYPTQTRTHLSSLMKLEASSIDGQLILFHGKPGTGKTYAIRSLVREWSSWCRTFYVLDPERLFNNASYLNSALLMQNEYYDEDSSIGLSALGALSLSDDEEEPSNDRNKWKLFLLEDADEFLTRDAKSQSGQGFSRLLNMTSGLIGQGLKILVLITTNEPLQSIHEAITRNGRCLSNIQFDLFNATEANEWLKGHKHLPLSVRTESITLARMYAALHNKSVEILKEGRAGFE